ncbi:MAG: sugar kinase [Deltaproteobacteria bacterium]|nr:sugar kinase [Deltaproteobacteria bacterium]
MNYNSTMKVAGLGQCSLDYIALLERYPVEDTKEEATKLLIQGGGPVATALVSLARLGVRTEFTGVVSDDDAGSLIIKGLKDEGVGVRNIKVRKGGASQTAFIVVNGRTGSRTILWKRPTVTPLKSTEVNAEFLKGADFLLLDGLMKDASLKAGRLAGKLGVPVMLDAGKVRDGMLELARLSDYIVASEEFARNLKLSPKDALSYLAASSPRAVTITLGKKGSVTWQNGKVFTQKAFRVKAVDTTGAGDVFHGGYIYGVLQKWDIRKTVEFASAFAALKCRKPGGRAGIPTLNETLRFIKR